MASPGDLIDTIASITGAPRARVFSAHRYLREAGFITQGGRGTSAAKMTCRDAAHLLLATASFGEVKDSPATMERPGGLVTSQGRWTNNTISIPELEELPAGHSFLDGIEALIRAAVSGSLQSAAEILEGGSVDLLNYLLPALRIEVTVHGPLPRGSILIQEVTNDGDDFQRVAIAERHYNNRVTKPGAGNLAWFDMARPKEMDSDLETRMTITHRTLTAVGNLLTTDSA